MTYSKIVNPTFDILNQHKVICLTQSSNYITKALRIKLPYSEVVEGHGTEGSRRDQGCPLLSCRLLHYLRHS